MEIRKGTDMVSEVTGNINRRAVLKSMGLAAGAASLSGTLLDVSKPARADEDFEISMQLGWLIDNGQLGEYAAVKLGYYRDANLKLKIIPGGPKINGLESVTAGKALLGQVSSSPSLMLARSSGAPIKCIAVGFQQHPFTYFSLRHNPIDSPQDMIGKTVATQSTARILLRALLAKHNIPEHEVEVQDLGADMLPLVNGQVDAVTGWATSLDRIKVLGDQRHDMRLWDAGIQLYANPYYVRDEVLQKHSDKLEAFITATAKGWAWVKENRKTAVEFLTYRLPNLDDEIEQEAVHVVLKYVFNEETKAHGWGTMNKDNWERQIQTYADLGQFEGPVPRVDDVMTTAILDATRGVRPKIG